MRAPREAPRLGLLERMSLAVAPRWAGRRLMARQQYQLARRHYEAAAKTRRTAGWRAPGTDANGASAPYLATLRNRARDMVRNNPHAHRGLEAIVNNMIAWGIRTQFKDDERLGKAYKGWCETTACDYDGRSNLYGLQALTMRTVVEAGEALVVRRRAPGERIPMKIQVLEPDFIDTTKTIATSDGGYILQGVEYDRDGRRRAVWVYDTHPGSTLPIGRRRLTSRPIPAAEVSHIYREDRPGQVRGVSWFAPVMIRMRDYDDFEDARLMSAKIAACFAAFVKTGPGGSMSPLVGQPDPDADDRDELTDRIEPALIQYLDQDQEIEFSQPPSFSGHEEASSIYLRAIAAGLGVTYEMITGDLRRVNYSSGRMGRLEFQRNIDSWRWQMFVPQFCDRVAGWFNEAAILAGVTRQMAEIEHHPPPLEPVDPEREANGWTRLVRAGFFRHDHVVGAYGFDPDTHYAEIQKINKELDDRDLVFDTDPRKVSASGLIQANAPPTGEPGGANS